MDELGQQGQKPWYLSKTILSAFGIAAVAILNMAGVAVSDSEAPAIAELTGGFATLILSGIAIWGRIVAKQKIG